MSDPGVSVLVASVGDSPALRRCLAAVAEQARELGAEVVVVLNAPPDGLSETSAQALAGLGARLEFEPEIGKSHALNRGVHACRGRVIAFTDDDTLPRPGWLRAITAPLVAAGRPEHLVGCGGPVVPVFQTAGAPDWFVALVTGKSTSFLGPRHDLGGAPDEYRLERRSARSPIGANCAYLRDVLLRYPFDPRLGPNRVTGMRGGEDVALGRRLLAAGYRVRYVPEAEVEHPVSPERATFDYARRGYLAQGVERVRVSHVLGERPVAARWIRFRLHRNRLLCALLVVGPRSHRIRRQLRGDMLRGMLAELEGRGDRLLAGLADEPRA
jgi:cellulose synthase/poly-beta-1,6-N-acetylglucosamine synthase-like glycosyltransferase